MDTKLYTNLVNDIKNKIISGELSPGDRLPSENELLDIYNISKTTISKSMQVLANEGYIVTVPRVGNFVSKPSVSKYKLNYDEEEILKKISNHSSLHDFNIDKNNENGKALNYASLYYQDGIAVCYILSSVHYYDEYDFSKEDADSMKYFDFLKRYHNLHALKKKIVIEAAPCPESISGLLQLQKYDAVLKIIVEYWDNEGNIAGSRTAFYQPAYVDFSGVRR